MVFPSKVLASRVQRPRVRGVAGGGPMTTSQSGSGRSERRAIPRRSPPSRPRFQRTVPSSAPSGVTSEWRSPGRASTRTQASSVTAENFPGTSSRTRSPGPANTTAGVPGHRPSSRPHPTMAAGGEAPARSGTERSADSNVSWASAVGSRERASAAAAQALCRRRRSPDASRAKPGSSRNAARSAGIARSDGPSARTACPADSRTAGDRPPSAAASTSPANSCTSGGPPSGTFSPNSVPRSVTATPGAPSRNPRAGAGTWALKRPLRQKAEFSDCSSTSAGPWMMSRVPRKNSNSGTSLGTRRPRGPGPAAARR